MREPRFPLWEFSLPVWRLRRENRLLSRADLDAVLPQRPVMLFKYDGHACVCNRAMLAALPPEIRKLRGMHVDSGELNQEAFFRAADFVSRNVSILDLLRGMLRGCDELAARGIGMMHSAEGGFQGSRRDGGGLGGARGEESVPYTALFPNHGC